MTSETETTPAPRWARVLVVLSWCIVFAGGSWFLWKGDPHFVCWVPLMVFFFLQIAAEGFSYKNPLPPTPIQTKLLKLGKSSSVAAVAGCLLCIILFLGFLFPFSIYVFVFLMIGPPVLWKLHTDMMMVVGRYRKATPPAPTAENAGNYGPAPWDTRAGALLAASVLIGMVVFPYHKTVLMLACFLNLVIWDTAGLIHFQKRRRTDRSRSVILWRRIAIGLLIIYAVWAARWLYDGLTRYVLEKYREPEYGEVYLALLGTLGVWCLLVSYTYNYLMIGCGWYEKDLTAEKARQMREPDNRPQFNCAECGITFRPGRLRCHFCGGPPAQPLSSVSKADTFA